MRSEIRTLKAGDVVVMPFPSSAGTCAFCGEGLPTSCAHVGFFSAQVNGTLLIPPIEQTMRWMPGCSRSPT